MSVRRCIQDGKLVILPNLPPKPRPRRQPLTVEQVMRDYAARERLEGILERQKQSPTDLIEIEIRRAGNRDLVGYKAGARHTQVCTSFQVADPDLSQIVRANRELSSTGESVRWSLTAQAKEFSIEIVVDADGHAAQVVYASDADLWTIIRDAEFRRARMATPRNIRDLSHRDLGALESIQRHGKTRPEFAASEEIDGLFAAGLVAKTEAANKPLALTDLGRKWFAERAAL